MYYVITLMREPGEVIHSQMVAAAPGTSLTYVYQPEFQPIERIDETHALRVRGFEFRVSVGRLSLVEEPEVPECP